MVAIEVCMHGWERIECWLALKDAMLQKRGEGPDESDNVTGKRFADPHLSRVMLS